MANSPDGVPAWHHLWVGSLKTYCIPTSTLGCGGRSIVIGASDSRSGDVAVKLPYAPGSCCNLRILQKCLRREGVILASVRHANVVHLIEAPSSGDFLIIEKLRPQTLQEFRRSDEWRPEFSLPLASKSATALHALHRAGFLHLDFKPRNILFRDGSYGVDPVLADLGSGRPICKPTNPATSGERIGSGRYVFKAPEQLFSDAAYYGVQTDAFALGASLHWLLTGFSPFSNSGTSSGDVRARYREEFDLLEGRLASLGFPRQLVDLTRSLLSLDPAGRPHDLGIVAQHLDDLARLPC